MKKCKLLITDLDGTLIETLSGDTFPKGIWDMKLKLYVFEAIKNYAPDDILIISNQGGIEKGFVDKEMFEYIKRIGGLYQYIRIQLLLRQQ